MEFDIENTELLRYDKKIDKIVELSNEKKTLKKRQFKTDRKQNSIEQKIFLINFKKGSMNDLEFTVMGTTKNIYIVYICESPKCTCMDFKIRHKRCKHIFFILRKIMKVNNTIEDNKIFSREELIEMITNIPINITSSVINDITSNKKIISTDIIVKMKIIDDEDICSICFDNLNNGEELDYCKYKCGKAIHAECFKIYCEINAMKCINCSCSWK
jgi:hypothetical protein